jgi:hypothetical protein
MVWATVGFSQSANAANTCTVGWEKTDVSLAPDIYRVWAWCSSLNARTQAKGTAVVSFGPDHNTAWFSQLNSVKYSAWKEGGVDSTRLSFRQV